MFLAKRTHTELRVKGKRKIISSLHSLDKGQCFYNKHSPSLFLSRLNRDVRREIFLYLLYDSEQTSSFFLLDECNDHRPFIHTDILAVNREIFSEAKECV